VKKNNRDKSKIHLHHKNGGQAKKKSPPRAFFVAGIIVLAVALLYLSNAQQWFFPSATKTAQLATTQGSESVAPPIKQYVPSEKWLQRAYAIDKLYHEVYTAGWEGANGAIGDAYLFAATHDSSLLYFHTVEHDMRQIINGTWVDDRAWACLAEMYWWNVTGRKNNALVADAEQRYLEARNQGRLSNHEGFWSWYNYPPHAQVNEPIITNSNMNQMASVACWLYEATGDKRFLNDALLVWNGDGRLPGIEQTLYRGNGIWKGKPGRAAFGKQLPWNGTEYCSIGASLYRVTHDPQYKKIVVATAEHIMNPANGWVDPHDFYQIHMDGNGAFVHFLMDAYEIAPDELKDIPVKVEKMLEHVWTNHHGKATVILHRLSDDGIRNGWNPNGGEDGYGVDEVGTVHAQSQAVRAFGVFAYFFNHDHFSEKFPSLKN
jgi:hypothetical protein